MNLVPTYCTFFSTETRLKDPGEKTFGPTSTSNHEGLPDIILLSWLVGGMVDGVVLKVLIHGWMEGKGRAGAGIEIPPFFSTPKSPDGFARLCKLH